MLVLLLQFSFPKMLPKLNYSYTFIFPDVSFLAHFDATAQSLRYNPDVSDVCVLGREVWFRIVIHKVKVLFTGQFCMVNLLVSIRYIVHGIQVYGNDIRCDASFLSRRNNGAKSRLKCCFSGDGVTSLH